MRKKRFFGAKTLIFSRKWYIIMAIKKIEDKKDA